MNKTNTNTLVVQAWKFFPILVFTFEMLYPAPALAFSNQPAHETLAFDQTITSASSIPSNPRDLEGKLVRFTAFAYTSNPALTDSSPTITASGTHTRYGIIATNVLPLGTRVTIGSDEFIVEDRMNNRYNHKLYLDIWLPSMQEAVHFGVQTVLVHINEIPE